MSMKVVIKKALKKAVPTDAEKKKITKVINLTKKSIEDKIKEMRINADVLVGGSVAKGTWIKGQHDIDFFIRFYGYPEEAMKRIFQKLVLSVFENAQVMHGSRDYFKVKYNKYDLELVPVLKIDSPSKAKNSMDASPFHVDYVKRRIEDNPDLANQIRLLKLFAKAINVYGAETHISGLSGYVTELLMIHFKRFENLVLASEEIKPKYFIDLEGYYKGFWEAKQKLSESKLKSPIIIIDPVLKERNACAALSYSTFSKLLLSLRLFLRKPSLSFFTRKEIKVSDLKERSKKRGTLLVTHTIPIGSKEDIFFAKLRKKINTIHSKIEKEDIFVYDYGYFKKDEKVVVYFELETLKVPKVKKHYGPPVWVDKNNFDAFLRKWKKVYVEKTNLVADAKRKTQDVRLIVKEIIKKGLKDVQ